VRHHGETNFRKKTYQTGQDLFFPGRQSLDGQALEGLVLLFMCDGSGVIHDDEDR
jgi:hypothetical protein